MNTLENMLQPLRRYWGNATVAGRLAAGVSVLATVALVAAVGVWSSRPQYVPLVNNASTTEMFEVSSALAAAGIPYKMNLAGSGVLVPKNQWNAARVAAGEHLSPSNTSSDPGMPGSSVFDDPATTHARLLRNKEDSLRNTLLRMPAVASADVHIAQPKPSPFPRHRQPATASIVLGFRPGAVFTPEHAATIVANVAASVEGLTTENVTVTDLDGRILAAPGASAHAGIFGRLEYKRSVEAALAAKVQTMLLAKLGPNKSVIQVNADVDYTESERTKKSFNPDAKVKNKERISSTNSTGGTRRAVGVPGVSGQEPTAISSQAAADATASETTEEIETTWQVEETLETIKESAGKTTRVTVSAMVELPTTEAGAAADISKADLEEAIKQAVGFDQSRGDQISVVLTSLAPVDSVDGVLVETRQWEFFNQLARNSSLGLAAVVALILGLLALKKVAPVSLESNSLEEESLRRERLLAELSRRVQENPETVSRILSAWLDEPRNEETADADADARPDTIPMKRAA